ncbi:TVP38/TMEM64 family membrane protein slr0305 isoform X1 [Gossypium hirsutum]|uniref:TVP38/TMEM64 family membrane protein slr0305 isoform X1 n=1 Tax=Gossypium hirsutum TaxID=3635 RepID=A0A1U8K633_GOSHI|nr:TVP38/TMEM64 family membrane protein slr0305-like isoform X1 [Gossypium hirsutum]
MADVFFTWVSAFRIVFSLLFLVATASVLLSLPIEKMVKGFLFWVKEDLGQWGPFVLALSYIPLTILVVPASILTQLGGGYLFGLSVGFMADSIGATLGATAAFILGRTIGKSYLISKLRNYPKFQAVANAIEISSFKMVFLLRLVPLLPFSLLNYLLSVTPVNLSVYVLASWLGMTPSIFGLAYIGTTIKDLSDVTHGWNEIYTIHQQLC